jgi:hypothetical protein
MIRRLLLTAAVLSAAACGGSHVTVEAALDEGRPIAGLPVWLLPYDRAALLDSLAAEADEPMPSVPPEWVERLRALDAALAGREVDAEARAEAAAERQAIHARIDSVRVAHRAWEEDVYGGFDEAVERRVRATGQSEKMDTTDARGIARMGADEGRWWVWARYVLSESTLEWNEPVLLRGDSARVRLTRENAREQPFF